MPAQKAKSGLSAKYGAGINTAVDAHKDDPLKFGAERLPAGIENGIAQLVDGKFDTYKEGDNKGEYFYHQRAVVVKPDVHDGIKVAGRQFSKTEAVCDTTKGARKSQAEHVAWIMQELRKLGWEPPKDRAVTADDLEAAAAALLSSAPYFKFTTFKGQKSEIVHENGKWYVVTGNKKEGPFLSEQALKVAKPFAGAEPMVNEMWNGATDFNMEQPDALTEAATEGPTDEAPAAAEASTEEVDLSALGEAADGGDETAMAQITELANAAEEAGNVGIAEQVAGAASWSEGAAMLATQGETNGEWKPAKGETVYYKPAGNDPATKKPYKKAIEHEVVSVNESAETVTLKDMATKKVAMGANKKPLQIAFADVAQEA